MGLFKYNIEILRDKYSLGSDPNTMLSDYLEAISRLKNIGEKEVGYVNLLWMVSLGILFEICTDELKVLVSVVKKRECG